MSKLLHLKWYVNKNRGLLPLLLLKGNLLPLNEHWDHCSVAGIATLREKGINSLMSKTWLDGETGESQSLPETMLCFVNHTDPLINIVLHL